MGARLGNYVSKAFTRNITRRFFWTDSSCVRNWIRSPAALYKPLVNHKIGKTQTLIDSSEWHFIPGKLNPSDHATGSAQDIEETLPTSWLDGAHFLMEPEE